MIFRREPGYLDNPVRHYLWRAGHADAGVLVILTLVGLLLVDQADLSSGLLWLVRYTLVAGPMLMPLGVKTASERAVSSATLKCPNGASNCYLPERLREIAAPAPHVAELMPDSRAAIETATGEGCLTAGKRHHSDHAPRG